MTFLDFCQHPISRPAFAKALLSSSSLVWENIPAQTQQVLASMTKGDDLHQRAWQFCQETGVDPVTLTEAYYVRSTGLLTNDTSAARLYHLVAPDTTDAKSMPQRHGGGAFVLP